MTTQAPEALIERWIGGAGTGKTTLLIRKLTEWKDKLGLAPEQVGLCTFTRNGRRQLSQRAAEAWGVEPELLTKTGYFRTAHSIAYRQISAQADQLISGTAGNRWLCDLFPGQLRPITGEETTYGDQTPVAMALSAWDLSRNRVAPFARVVNEIRQTSGQCPEVPDALAIVQRYELAKTKDSKLDFTDLVARFAGVRFPYDGSDPRVGVKPEGDVPEDLVVLAIDEAQDSSGLVDLVCRRLAASPAMRAVFLCGDPYQSIFSFTGSDYRHFKSWEAAEYVMPESFRCPPQIMEVGERCIRAMKEGYVDRGIKPAAHSGQVMRAVNQAHAFDLVPSEGSVLVVGRCGFSLGKYVGFLNERGIPNRSLDAGGTTATIGAACYWQLQTGQCVSGDEWEKAISMTTANHKTRGLLLKRGEKTAWAAGRRAQVDVIMPNDDDLRAVGCTDTLIQMIRSGEWTDAVDPDHKDAASLFSSTANKHGLEEAMDPRIKLSTIHAAKGAEADTVIVSTISSPSVERARFALQEAHDEECRVAYVAVTRARKRLIVVDDAENYAMTVPTGG